MSTDLADTVGAELARLYAEWEEANATAAAILNNRTHGKPLGGYRLEEFQKAEARTAALVARYQAAATRRR